MRRSGDRLVHVNSGHRTRPENLRVPALNNQSNSPQMESPPKPSSSSFNPADYCARGLLRFCDPATTPSYPEPPSPVFAAAAADSPSGATVSPLIIGFTTVLVAAFLLFSCCIAYIYYKRGGWSRNQEDDNATSLAPPSPDLNGGLDEQIINSLTVFKYRGDGLVGPSTECAVCLAEFIEDESLRLMTNCQHAFHLPCIDAWLRSHSNCPTCRASIIHSAEDAVILS